MPELPEVQTIVDQLQEEIKGYTLKNLYCFSEKVCQPNQKSLQSKLTGRQVTSVQRIGKLIVITFGDDVFLVIHLKLTGRFLLLSPGQFQLRWERARFEFNNKKTPRSRLGDSGSDSESKYISFEDMRLFGYLKLVNGEDFKKIKQKLGHDALEIMPTTFFEKIRKRKVAIKKILLDQAVISGVGNIYANEALFLARLDPRRLSNSLTMAEVKELVKDIKKVLTIGLQSGGATLSDEMYRDIYNRKGGYYHYVLVYDREGDLCPNHCGGKIQKMQLGGRGTFFCPNCQH